ncbi:MAG: alpha/beta hydrolase [Halobacteriovoraceae bacterium]|nr:alpha/beta hydrolase [Halobacteriovoraceae bacterium]
MAEPQRDYFHHRGFKHSYLFCGDSQNPMLILLHGFPEDARAWSSLMKPLSENGFFVVAPDILGYGRSDTHGRVKDSRLDLLMEDLIFLALKYDKETFQFVGHDWGAAIGWELLRLFPEKVTKAVLMNSPSLRVFKRALLFNPLQILRSWYMFFFQMPWLPETLMFARDKWVLKKALKDGSRGKIEERRITELCDLWDTKRKISSMIALYRLLPSMTFHRFRGDTKTPLLLIGGGKDPFIKTTLLHKSIRGCKEGKVLILSNSGHFPHYEEPKELFSVLKGFFQL